jgi:SsrA-binding protein
MGIKVIAKYKRAGFDYFLHEKFEAGLVLKGTEVKSLRDGKVSLTEAHISIEKGDEVYIYNMTIGHYEFGNLNNHEETRKRKLLLNKSEIAQIKHELKAGGMTVVPTMIYFKESLVKLEIALAKGKKLHDKRDTAAKKDVERKLRRGDYT